MPPAPSRGSHEKPRLTATSLPSLLGSLWSCLLWCHQVPLDNTEESALLRTLNFLWLAEALYYLRQWSQILGSWTWISGLPWSQETKSPYTRYGTGCGEERQLSVGGGASPFWETLDGQQGNLGKQLIHIHEETGFGKNNEEVSD